MLPLQPSREGVGRSSAHLFSEIASPMGKHYSEWRKLSCISNKSVRKSIQKIRHGQLQCATELSKRNQAPHSLACTCGHPTQDPYHVVLECPHTQPARAAVMDSARVASQSDSQLNSLILNQSEVSVLKASLGASIPGPWRRTGSGPYNTLVGLAGPIWSRELASFL